MKDDIGAKFHAWAVQFKGGFEGFPNVEKLFGSYLRRYPAEGYRKMSDKEFRKFMLMLLKLDDDPHPHRDTRKQQ